MKPMPSHQVLARSFLTGQYLSGNSSSGPTIWHKSDNNLEQNTYYQVQMSPEYFDVGNDGHVFCLAQGFNCDQDASSSTLLLLVFHFTAKELFVQWRDLEKILNAFQENWTCNVIRH